MSSRIWDTFVSKCVTKNFLKTRNLVTLMCVRERKVKCKFREIENSLFTWFQFNNKTNFDTKFLDSLSLSHIHFLYISFSLFLSLSLSLTHTLSLSHTHTLSFSHTLSLTHTPSLSHTLSLTHTHPLSHTLTHPLSNTHTHFHPKCSK